jgi:hypothetical protein
MMIVVCIQWQIFNPHFRTRTISTIYNNIYIYYERGKEMEHWLLLTATGNV